MELTWIEDFLELARLRHFTRAAAARHATQPAFSRRIQQLEQWLGTPLIRRAVRPLAFTPAGEDFRRRAAQLRSDMLDARRAALSLTSHFSAATRIITTNTIASTFLPGWLARQNFAGYGLQVASVTGCLEAVRQDRAQLALISRFTGDAPLDGLTSATVGADSLALYAAPDIAARVVLNGRTLTGPVMAYAPGTAYGRQIAALLARRQIALAEPPLCESASAEALAALALAGMGAAWLPKLLVANTLQGGLERCAVPASLDLDYVICAVRPAAPESSRLPSG